MKFTNSAKQIKREYGNYSFDRPSPYLFVWSRLFQSVISQAGTFLLTGKFHDRQCSIYKAEGGCVIDGVGDLVLSTSSCYFDHWHSKSGEKKSDKIAELISHIVLNWNPEDPIESMLQIAADFIKQDKLVLRKAIESSTNGGVFGGNALANFFNWNPFTKAPIDREYLRFCLTTFEGKTNEEVDQKYADEDLGENLLKRLQEKAKNQEKMTGEYVNSPMCCSPNRKGNKLNFWVNTGRRTQVDGWKTQKELEDFINSEEKYIDTAKY